MPSLNLDSAAKTYIWNKAPKNKYFGKALLANRSIDLKTHIKQPFFKFNFGDIDINTVTKLIFELHARATKGTDATSTVPIKFAVSKPDDWDETTLTWENQPSSDRLVTKLVKFKPNTVISLDLTPYLQKLKQHASDNKISFSLLPSDTSDIECDIQRSRMKVTHLPVATEDAYNLEFSSYTKTTELAVGAALPRLNFAVYNKGQDAEIRVYLRINGDLKDKEPDLYWKDIGHLGSWAHYLSGKSWRMPDHDVSVRLYIGEQHSGETQFDLQEWTISPPSVPIPTPAPLPTPPTPTPTPSPPPFPTPTPTPTPAPPPAPPPADGDIRVGTGVSESTLLGVTTSFSHEYAHDKYVYMMYRKSGIIPAGAVKWYRWGHPTPNVWNLITPCTWNYTGIYSDHIYSNCKAGTGRYKVTFGGISREYTVAEAPAPIPTPTPVPTPTPPPTPGPIACLQSISPGVSTAVPGSTVAVKIVAYNCGDRSGLIYATVFSDAFGEVTPLRRESVEPSGTVSSTGDFVMPDHDVMLYFLCGHHDGRTWVEDKRAPIHIYAVTPRPTPTPTPIPECPRGDRYNIHAWQSCDPGYTKKWDIADFYYCQCDAAVPTPTPTPAPIPTPTPTPPPFPYLTIIPTSQNVSAIGGAGTTITIESNVTWYSHSDVPWLHVLVTGRTGNGFVPVTVDANAGLSSRTGTITIAGGGLTRTCTVTQAGAGVPIPTPSPTPTPTPPPEECPRGDRYNIHFWESCDPGYTKKWDPADFYYCQCDAVVPTPTPLPTPTPSPPIPTPTPTPPVPTPTPVPTPPIPTPMPMCINPTTNFDTGCALLLSFDTDNDGIISEDELHEAGYAEQNGMITGDEFDFVNDAHLAGSINALCPNCFGVPTPTPPPAPSCITIRRPLEVPENVIQGITTVFPCTILNNCESMREVKVFLIDRDTGEELDVKPVGLGFITYWRNIEAGESHSFHFAPHELLNTVLKAEVTNLRIEVRHQRDFWDKEGILDDAVNFTVAAFEAPSWFDPLLVAIGLKNQESISNPILDLFAMYEMEGWTEPPFVCPICGAEFVDPDRAHIDFASHLTSHLKAFFSGWFKKEEES